MLASAGSGGQGPTIVAAVTRPRPEVTGHGFRPKSAVMICVVDSAGTMSYFHYSADWAGDLTAALPPSLPHGTLRISASDSRPDPSDETGIRWTNTATITW